MFRAIVSMILFSLVYMWIQRLLRSRRPRPDARAARPGESAGDKHAGAIDAEFEELDSK
jgi:hypothetical protein